MMRLCIDEMLVVSKSELRKERVLPRLALSAAMSCRREKLIVKLKSVILSGQKILMPTFSYGRKLKLL